MTSSTATSVRPVDEAQLRGLVAQVDRQRGVRLLVVEAAPTWDGPAVVDVDGVSARVVTGRSVLAVRSAIVDHPDEFLAVLTPVPMAELGEEVRARSWRQRAHTPSPWDAVMALCKVTAVDPWLRDKRWMVDLLVRVAPARGYAQPASQVLDRDTAWRNLYRYALDLGVTPTTRALLRWAATTQAREAVSRLDEKTRQRVAGQLAIEAGPAAVPVIDLVAAGRGQDALMIGLIVDAVWRAGDQGGRIRVEERYLSQDALGDAVSHDWASAAVAELHAERTAGSAEVAQTLLHRADDVLSAIAPGAKAASSVLDGGFDARLAHLGRRLTDALADPTPQRLQTAIVSLDAVRDHLRAESDGHRVLRAEAAVRLVRRALVDAAPGPDPTTLAALATDYVADGAWVDAARHQIAEGETVTELANVYHRLLTRLRDDGQARDRSFAAAVAAEAARPTTLPKDLRSASTMAIEHVLSTVVGPLAEQAPVLLLVIDGLSHAAAVPLERDLRATGWQPLGPDGGPLPAVVAALPTVTQVSRASLLRGQLTTGGQDVERDGFTTAAPLVDAGRGQAPRLFHKSDLKTTDGQIAPAVRDTLGDPGQRVVGVVVNAVDDHLAKGSQLRLEAGLDGVPVLRPLLDAAAQARRIVVVTSDHGHILGAEQQVIAAPGGGERFRVTEAPANSYEVELTGERVLWGDHRVVAAAEETVRYIAVAKHGYHGGATPAEALCPLLVMVFGGEDVAGWEPLVPQVPRWWAPELAPIDVDLSAPVSDDNASDARGSAPPAAGPSQPSLLDPEPAVSRVDGGAPAWIGELLASPRLKDQRRLAGRMQLDDDDLTSLLRVLHAAGNRASGAALQRTLGLSPSRLRSKLGAARTLLNVEGYAVLRVETDGTAVLAPRLLADQFELPSLGGGPT